VANASSKKSSSEKLSERSDYDRGKLDGLVEAVELLREQANELDKTFDRDFRAKATAEEVKLHIAFTSGLRKSSLNLWNIYRRRAI
jgi:hypothetical protein